MPASVTCLLVGRVIYWWVVSVLAYIEKHWYISKVESGCKMLRTIYMYFIIFFSTLVKTCP